MNGKMAAKLARLSDVTSAQEQFPPAVFRAWLKARQRAAYLLLPGWKNSNLPVIQRVLMLDHAARRAARWN